MNNISNYTCMYCSEGATPESVNVVDETPLTLIPRFAANVSLTNNLSLRACPSITVTFASDMR